MMGSGLIYPLEKYEKQQYDKSCYSLYDMLFPKNILQLVHLIHLLHLTEPNFLD